LNLLLVKGIIKGRYNESYTPFKNHIGYYGSFLVLGIITIIGSIYFGFEIFEVYGDPIVFFPVILGIVFSVVGIFGIIDTVIKERQN